MKKLMIICSLIIAVCCNYLYSQTWGCADLNGCTEPWSTEHLVYYLSSNNTGSTGTDVGVDNNCRIECDYRYRVCPGPPQTFEIEYANVQVLGNCSYMQDFSYLHYNFSSINELLDILIIGDQNNNSSIGTCPTTSSYAHFYSASCGIWLKCTYQVAPQTPVCDKGWSPLPDPKATTVDVWKWQPCGTACCKRTYEICKKNSTNPYYTGTTVEIKAMTKVKIGSCTGDPAPGGNDTYAKPCEDGC